MDSSVITDHYEFLLPRKKCLGKGGYGYVTLVKHKKSKLDYAVKVVHKEMIEEFGAINELKREIENHKL